MSLFSNCESCNEIGRRACGCENPPHFFCDSHVKDHIMNSGDHSIRVALESLTSSEISSIKEGYDNYRLISIYQAINIRNSQIEHLLQQIRIAEDDCCSALEGIFSGPIAREIQDILSYQALPLYSESILVQSLLDLKKVSNFSSSKITDLLNTLNSSFMSSFPSFTALAPFSRAPLLPTAPVQASSTPHSSVQRVRSQKPSTQTLNRTKYRWELLQETQAHSRWIFSIAVSESEKYVASASLDKTIKIWEIPTLNLLWTLKGHTDTVLSVAFLGNKVVSGSGDTTIKIWEEDRCVNTLNLYPGLFSAVNSVCVSSCKRLVVSGSSDKTAVVFRLEDNNTLHVLKHTYEVRSVAFSHDNKEIVSGSGNEQNGRISIWKTETGELLKTLKAHSAWVSCVKFSGTSIVSSSNDRTLKIWDSDKNKPLVSFTDHTRCVSSVDVKDDAVASLAMDDRIIVRHRGSGKILQTLQAHGKYPSGGGTMGLKLLERENYIVSGGGDGKVKIWRRID